MKSKERWSFMILKISWDELRATEKTEDYVASRAVGPLIRSFKEIAAYCGWEVTRSWNEEDWSWTFKANE